MKREKENKVLQMGWITIRLNKYGDIASVQLPYVRQNVRRFDMKHSIDPRYFSNELWNYIVTPIDVTYIVEG